MAVDYREVYVSEIYKKEKKKKKADRANKINV